MKKFLAMLALLASTHVNAAVMTFNLKDIGTFSDFMTSDTSLTFSGTGFAGMYIDAWVHILGLEQNGNSKSHTVMQVDTATLLGKSIASATLSFKLSDGEPGTQTTTLTAFKANGALAFSWDAPGSNYGAVMAPTEAEGVNEFDVTQLLKSSLQAGDSWFGMHLAGSSLNQWTDTSREDTRGAADVMLTVEYDVPAPQSLALMVLGLAMLAAAARRSRP